MACGSTQLSYHHAVNTAAFAKSHLSLRYHFYKLTNLSNTTRSLHKKNTTPQTSNMAATRLRRTFQYPSESDDEDAVEQGMDEQGTYSLPHPISPSDPLLMRDQT
jgi:hypothetical protein